MTVVITKICKNY